ncbi:MAG: Ig-like domain-containing protein [Cyclobacteriaceae bacterium]|nr:Ig-like domain-containing protein [Cyclobacteriaceae bacterium]
MRSTLVSILLSFYILLLWSCANQTTPMGGPKDETPPSLIKSTPTHKQRNFKGKEIELVFDEAINLNNPNEEILISPRSDQKIEFKVKKNTVTLSPEKGWNENTTYSIAFREGIRDITENNAPKNLKLAFSTGPLIDSMVVKGRVKMALNTKIPEKITVALYESDTFNIFEHSPSYFTLINDKGTYSLENIKSGNYYLYAFQDNNKNLKVESRTEKFGFLKDKIELTGPIDSLTIPLINMDMRPLSINNIRNTGILTRIKFNKSIIHFDIKAETNEELVNSFGDDQTEITIYNPEVINDSLKIVLNSVDSIGSIIDTIFYIKPIKSNSIPSDFTVSAENIKYNLSTNTLTQNLRFSKPIKAINTDSIFVQLDSLTHIPIAIHDFSYDTVHKKLILSKHLPSDSLFRPPTLSPPNNQSEVKRIKGQPGPPSRPIPQQAQPELIFIKGAIISQESDTLKAQKFPITETKKASTGTLLIEVQTKKTDFIIQLTTSQGEVIEEIKNLTKYSFQYLKPGNYTIRAIIDSNQNGIWDPGNFFKKEEPEMIWFYKTQDKKYDFPIRANWELGPLLLIF